MPTFQHRFDKVDDYLHHRAPYLMIDRIVSIDGKQVVTEKRFTGEEPFAAGHFPGAPIMPGAMMQEMTTQSAGVLIAANFNPMSEFNTSDPTFNEFALGVLVKVKRARYKSFARPGDLLVATVRLLEQVDQIFDFRGSVSIGQRKIMQIEFQLANIQSTVLSGAAEN